MSAITAKASRKMKKYAVLTREPRCFLGSFDFSWEQRKLGDVVKEITRNDPESEAPIMMITANNGFIEQSERYAFNNAGESLKKYILLKKGELAYNHGASKLRPYGSCFALTTAENARIPFVYHCFAAENQNAEFMSIELNGAEIENQLRKIVSSGARMDGLLNISFDEYTSVSVILPGTEEQDRIADFFRHLDNLITLHQRKCVFLFGFFQAFISMIFTASTFSWEQRKVGDLLIERNQQAPMSDEYPLMAFIANEGVAPKGERYDRSALVTDTVNKLYKKTEKGDFIYSSNNLETGSIGLNKYGKACISPVYSIFEPTGIADSDFLGRRLVRKDFINAMVKWRQGVIYGQWRIHESDFLKIEIPVPSVEEQRKIGAYLDQLDNLITLHQRQHFLHSTPDISLSVRLIHPFYTSSWEQRKLSEITDKVTEKNAGLQYVETFTNSAEFGIISQRDFFDHDIAKLGSLDGYYIVKNEDFVYNPRISTSAPVGPINRNKLGRTGVMSPLYTVFRPHDIDTTYLEYFFKCGYWHSFMNFNGDSGARSDRFSIRDNVFFQMPIPIPDIDEQRKIGELLTCLDNLITLHQRECISFTARAGRLILTANKKRNTSSWEQRKLGELVDRVVRKNINNESTLPLTISAQYGLVDQITYFNNRVASRDVSNYYLVLNGEFAYNKSTSDGYPFGAVKRLDLYEKGVLSTLYIVFAPKKEQQIDSDYLTVFFDTDRWHKGVAERAAEGARNHGLLNISAEDFFDIDLSVPKDIVEQKQIGAFIRQLDNLITLHQRKPFLMKWRTSDANRNQTNRLVL